MFVHVFSAYFPFLAENNWLNFKFVALVWTGNVFLEYQNRFAHVL